MKKFALTIITVFLLGFAYAQVTNVKPHFTCPSGVTVTYDLNTTNPTNVTLYYSPDEGKTWLIAQTVSGALTAQTTGTGKTIVWNNKADNVSFGSFLVKVEVPAVPKVECVEINGTCWATRNVNDPGTFVENPQDYGKFYQWNRKVAWASTGTVTGWNTTTPTGTTWAKANDPCPTGYRVPTKAEQDALVAAGSTWTSNYNGTGVAGRIFGSGSNTVFFPAAGYRDLSDGTLNDAGAYGDYWSSTENGSFSAYFLDFYSSNASVYYSFRTYGFSVRCVSE